MKRLYFIIAITLLPLLPCWGQLKYELTVNEQNISHKKWDGYDIVRIWGENTTQEIGKPELPVLTRHFALPAEASVTDLKIQASNERTLEGSYFLLPVQPPQVIGQSTNGFIEPDSTYWAAPVYPADTATIIADRMIHGYHVVSIAFHPFVYKPSLRELQLRDIAITLEYSMGGDASIDTSQPESQNRFLLSKAYVKSMVENPDDVEQYANASSMIPQKSSTNPNSGQSSLDISMNAIEELVPDYVLITNEELREAFQPLVDWRTKTGMPAVMETVETIGRDYAGSDLAEKIRNYLLEMKKRWNKNSLFVLLGGDSDIIPARLAYGDHEKEEGDPYYGADMYYVIDSVKWNFYGPDPFKIADQSKISSYIGRIPVRTKREAETFVTKLLSYERADNRNIDYSYFENSLIANAYLESPQTSYGAFMGDLVQFCKGRDNNYWYLFDHFNCTANDHAQVLDTILPHGAELCRENFLSALQSGMEGKQSHFVYHLDHSETTHMGASAKDKGQYIRNEDIDNMPDMDYPKVFLSSGCHPARFDKDCIAEHLLKKVHGGAVAFIGNTDVGWYSENAQLKAFLDMAFAPTADSKEQYSLGYIHSKVAFAVYRSLLDYWRLHLLGDPATPIWTSKPRKLQVTWITDPPLWTGENEIAFKVENLPEGEPATICLMKGNEAYASKVIKGPGTHRFTFKPRTSGMFYLTITAHNFEPYEFVYPVTVGNNPDVQVHSLFINDDEENTCLVAGDTINAAVELTNNGNEPLTNVTATLSANSSYIHLVDSVLDFGNIAAKAHTELGKKFRFNIDKDAPETRKNDFNAVCFFLHIKDEDGILNADTFHIDIHTQELVLGEQSVTKKDDGWSYLTVRLWNTGTAAATGLKARLSSPRYACEDSLSAYPDIAPDNSAINERDFSYFESPLLPYLPTDTLILNVTNEYGKEWKFIFDPKKKGHPIGSDSLKTITTDSSIQVFWGKGSGNKRYAIFRSTSPNDTYTLLNRQPLTESYYEDRDIRPFTMYYYKVAGISDFNNFGSLSDSVTGMVAYPLAEGFPKTSRYQAESSSSINLADTNGDGLLEIFYGMNRVEPDSIVGRIVGLTCHGKELLDGNSEKVLGMGCLPTRMSAIPAIADIENNGNHAIIMPTDNDDLSKNAIRTFYIQDNNNDGWADYNTLDIPVKGCHGIVLDNTDNSPDGTLELVSKGGGNTPVRILSADLSEKYAFGNGYTYSSPAVADLDNDEDKEIIFCNDNAGVSIYHHDGTLMTTLMAETDLSSSPVICDLDNDGEKEIIVSQKHTRSSHIYALNLDGTQVEGWGTQTVPYTSANGSGLDHRLSVGDIDGDGNLEVVTLGRGGAYAWKNTGEQILYIKQEYLFLNKEWKTNIEVAVLGDVDGDSKADILFKVNNKIYAYRYDGTLIPGFPLTANRPISRNIAIRDIDADGYNEVIAVDVNAACYVWDTLGNGGVVEWGSERGNSRNTGEYGVECRPMVVSHDTAWDGETPCGNLIVRSGNLTLNAHQEMTLSPGSRIIVCDGGTLTIDGATVSHAHIWAREGSHVSIKNGGIVRLSDSGALKIEKGASLEQSNGRIILEE